MLSERVDPIAPFVAVGVCGLLAAAILWTLRLRDSPAVAPMKRPPPTPISFLPRYFRQPRLRLAYVLAVGRSAWWVMFFVYGPIYLLSVGFDAELAGMIASLGAASLFLVPLWGWVGRRRGLRVLLMGAYGAAAVSTIAVGFAADLPTLGLALLVLSAFAAGAIDGAGNLPFLRAVHPYERAEMTAVFTTFRDASQIATPGLFALILRVAELPAVFVASGVSLLAMTFLSRYLPRRL